MTIVNELNKLAEKITGTNPKATTDKKVLDYIADYFAKENLKPTTNAQAIRNITDNYTGGGSSPILEEKNVTITENTTTQIKPNTGYDGLSQVNVTTNVSESINLSPTILSFANSTTIIEELDVSPLDLSQISTFYGMFGNNPYLTTINFGNLYEATEVTNCEAMFGGCSSLESVDLSQFDLSNITEAGAMFSDCSSLQFIDIRTLPLSNLQSYEYIFDNVPTDCVIVVADETEQTWFLTNYPDFTNVVTATDYDSQE